MDRNLLAALVALAEIVALEHARDVVLRCQLDHVDRSKLVHPGGVERHFGLFRIEHLENLRLIRVGIFRDLIAGHRRSSGIFSRRITDHSGEIPDQKNDVMTKILKLPELVDQYSMSEMKIRCSRIEAGLAPQRMALLEFLDELRLDDQLAASAFRNFQLFFDIHAVRCNGRIPYMCR